MKKIMIIGLCLTFIFVNIMTAFAETRESQIGNKGSIQLNISKSKEEIEIMKNSALDKYGYKELSYNKEIDEILKADNLLELNIGASIEKEGYKLISGYGIIKLGKVKRPFEFHNVKFKKLEQNGYRNFSYGCVEVPESSEGEPILIDIVEADDFSEVIATTSCGVLEEGVGVIFWGNLFEEYETFYDLQMDSIAQPELVKSNNASVLASSGRNYDYVGKNRYEGITGGSGGNGETVIVVVGKRDFRDGNATNGYEMIRVFSRTGKAKNYIDGATSAYAIEANVDFTCTTKNLLDVSDVSPKSTSPSMPKVFNFFASLYPALGSSIAAVDLVGFNKAGSVNHTINSTSGHSFDNHANIKIDTSMMSSSDINLPASTTYTKAQEDTSHGAVGEIQYQKYMNISSGSVTAKGRIKYRFYYSTHRYTSAYTNYASVTHTIYNN